MSKRVETYDAAYGNFSNKVSQEVRKEAFGDDIGQNSWITTDEFLRFLKHLGLKSTSNVLEIACGSGGPALFMARTFGCHVTGIDINEKAIAYSRQDDPGSEAGLSCSLHEVGRWHRTPV